MTNPDNAFDKAFFIPADANLSAEEILSDADARIARIEAAQQEQKFETLLSGGRKLRRQPVL
jgi:hypothetical protein